MSQSPGIRLEREERWREELHKAEHWYTVAIAQTQKVLDAYDSLPTSEGDFALMKALQFQKDMMDEYADVFTRLTLAGEPREASVRARLRKQREGIKQRPLSMAAGSKASL